MPRTPQTWLLPVLTTILIAGCATAAEPLSEAAPEAVTNDSIERSAAGEQLIAQPPLGWRQTGAVNTPALKRAEFVPEQDDEADWVRRITMESMVEEPLPDPIAFVDMMTADRDRDCGTFRRHPTFAGEENGYPTAVYLLICHQDKETGRSEVTMLKAIQGNDAFYVITRSMRGEPIPAEVEPDINETVIGGWAVYLRSISVCESEHASGRHPCP